MAAVVQVVNNAPNNEGSGGSLNMWQDLALTVSKTMTMYCALSLTILCILTWLVLSGNISSNKFVVLDTTTPTPPPTKDHTHNRVHAHDAEFYMFVLTLLVSLRGGLFYMATALKRPIKERNISSMGSWLVGEMCILVGELVLCLSLLKCLPGAHILILLFLCVEIFAQAAFVWVVWNFRMELVLAG